MAAGEKLLDLGQDPCRDRRARARGPLPSTSSNRAPGMWSARYRPALHRNDFVAGMDDQGGHGDRRQDRPHIDPKPRFERRARHPRAGAHALHHCELADRPHRRQQSLERLAAAPRRAAARHKPASGRAAAPRACSPHPARARGAPAARPDRGRSHPSRRRRSTRRAGKNQRPRSLRSCCREDDGGRAALARPEKHRLSKPAASMTASISAARSSSVRTCGTGSDSPTPALSNRRMRQNVASRSKKATNSGTVQYSSMWLANDPAEDELDRPVPEHLIRQAQIATRCVRCFRHGMSVLRPGASPTVSTASRPGVRQRRHFRPPELCRALIGSAAGR